MPMDTKQLKNIRNAANNILRDMKVLERKYDDFDASETFDLMAKEGIEDPEEAYKKSKGEKTDRGSNGLLRSDVSNEVGAKELSMKILFNKDSAQDEEDEHEKWNDRSQSSQRKPAERYAADGRKIYPNGDTKLPKKGED